MKRFFITLLFFMLIVTLMIPGMPLGYLLWGPPQNVTAQEAGYLTSAGERAYEQNWAPITYNLAARWVFTHTPKLVHIVNDSGGKGFIKINSASLDVTTPTAHILLQNDTDLWLGTIQYGDKPLKVSSIDFVLWDTAYVYTLPLTAGTQIKTADWWAVAWW